MSWEHEQRLRSGEKRTLADMHGSTVHKRSRTQADDGLIEVFGVRDPTRSPFPVTDFSEVLWVKMRKRKSVCVGVEGKAALVYPMWVRPAHGPASSVGGLWEWRRAAPTVSVAAAEVTQQVFKQALSYPGWWWWRQWRRRRTRRRLTSPCLSSSI